MSSFRTDFAAARSHPPLSDVLLAAAVTVATVPMSAANEPFPPTVLGILLTSLLMTASLVLRRWCPLAMVAVMFVAGLGQLIFVAYPTASLLAVPIAAYSAARWVAGAKARLVVIGGGIGSIAGPLRWAYDAIHWGGSLLSGFSVFVLTSGICLFAVVTPYIVGRRFRDNSIAQQHAAEAALRQYRAELSAREQDARMTEARVRNDIARELHDIVAHSLSVIIVQAEGGRALAAKKPEQAVESLETIAQTGREALGEMRRIVGVLRGDPKEGSADFVPMPGLRDIPALVAKASDRVSLHVVGTEPEVPQTVGVTVYRIVQEAVTNVLKHAGPQARASVTLSYLAMSVVIDVVDDGLGQQAGGDNQGHGLRGMYERVTSMGGTLTAGPRPEGGYQVHCILPLPSAVTRPTFQPFTTEMR